MCRCCWNLSHRLDDVFDLPDVRPFMDNQPLCIEQHGRFEDPVAQFFTPKDLALSVYHVFTGLAEGEAPSFCVENPQGARKGPDPSSAPLPPLL